MYIAAASGLSERGVQRLLAIRSGKLDGPATLAVRSTDEVLDYVPQLPAIGQRLARRCWPGPVTLQLPDAQPESAIYRLPAPVREAVVPGGEIRLRVPAHEMVLSALRLLSQVGICLFMFAVGMEMNLQQVRSSARTAIVVSQTSIVVNPAAASSLVMENLMENRSSRRSGSRRRGKCGR